LCGKNKKMKILILSQYFWPENFRINEIAMELINLGNKVTVITGKPNYPEGKIYDEFLKDKKFFCNYNSVKIIRVPIIPRGKGRVNLLINYISFVLSACTYGLFKLRNKKFDLIFVFQTSPVLVGIPSSLISKIKRIPQVFWVLDIWPETLESLGIKNKFLIEIVRNLVKKIYLNCDVILAQSKSFVKNIKSYKSLKSKQILYFPVWSELNYDSRLIEKYPSIKTKKVFTILFAGNIGKAQDFESVIKAIKFLSTKVKDFRLVIVGEGSKKEWLIKATKENKLEKIIEIYKKIPLEKMPSIFTHADALLVTLSDQIAFNMTIPGKVQTYLSTGIPIIGMLNGEGASTIHESGAGFACDAGDYIGLAELIIKMKNTDNKTRSEMGLLGKIYSEKEFNKKVLMIKLNNIFKELVDKKLNSNSN